MTSLWERLEIGNPTMKMGTQHWKTGVGGREERMRECGVEKAREKYISRRR